MIIEKFSNAENGRITGFLDTLSRDVALTFVPQSKGAAYISHPIRERVGF